METSKQPITRSQLVNDILPRQLSALDFMALVGEQEMFTEAEQQEILVHAEQIALPGKARLRACLEGIVQAFSTHSMDKELGEHYDMPQSENPHAMSKHDILVVTVSAAGYALEMHQSIPMSKDLGSDVSYKLQHENFDEKFIEKVCHQLTRNANMAIRKSMQGTEFHRLDTLLAKLPPDMRLVDLLELVGKQRIFSNAAVNDLFERAEKFMNQHKACA